MSLSSGGNSTRAVPEVAVRTASSGQLVASAETLESAICFTDALDPRMADLVRRSDCIRRELGRRQELLMQDTVWTTSEPTDPVVNGAKRAPFTTAKTRNGRGGPGGPGGWDD